MRLRTIGLIGILVLGLLATPLPAEAQQAGKVYKIGILRSGSSSSKLCARQHKILRQSLQKLGYTEGKNLLIEYQMGQDSINASFNCVLASLTPLPAVILVPS